MKIVKLLRRAVNGKRHKVVAKSYCISYGCGPIGYEFNGQKCVYIAFDDHQIAIESQQDVDVLQECLDKYRNTFSPAEEV